MEKCSGEGQGTCKRCKDMGIWNRNWMSFLYKVEGYEGIYCYDCAKYLEELKQENEHLKEVNRLGCLECEYKNTKADLDKAEQKLERIKEYCKIHTDFCKNNKNNCEVCSLEPCEDIQILQIIEGE